MGSSQGRSQQQQCSQQQVAYQPQYNSGGCCGQVKLRKQLKLFFGYLI